MTDMEKLQAFIKKEKQLAETEDKQAVAHKPEEANYYRGKANMCGILEHFIESGFKESGA